MAVEDSSSDKDAKFDDCNEVLGREWDFILGRSWKFYMGHLLGSVTSVARLFFQCLALYNNAHMPNGISICQRRFTLLPNP